MKTAIDCYARGKQREANADEYSRMRSYSQGRFICPECGELVHLTGSKYSNHFSHYKKTDISAQCDRRVDGMPTQSVYERIGLPLYLRKDGNGDFRLFMGFRSLPISVLEQAERNKVFFKIVGTEQKYRVTRERFIDGETTLIPILHIPFGQAKYRLKYEPINFSSSILSCWSDEADGFSYDGALFSVTALGGKKIRHGDTVSTDVEYYWVRRNSSLPSYISGIKMKRVGNLILKDTKYSVFQGMFDSSVNDMEFSRLTTYLRESLKVHLLEKQPDFIPVWPPCLKTENGYTTPKNNRWLYGRVQSGNDDPKIYVYRGIAAIPEQEKMEDGVAKVMMSSTDTYISIDRKYVSGGVNILKHDFQLVGKKIDIEINQEIKTRGYENIELQNRTDNVEIKLPYEFDLIYLKNNGESIYKKRIKGIVLENIANHDCILMTSNQTVYFVFEFRIDEEVGDETRLTPEKLFEAIRFYTNTKKVKIPHQYRIELYKKYDNSIEIKKLLRQDEIPVPVLKILEEL
ncbi:MAG: hypothetical protein MSA72_00615 [Lachnospiraceae bacterium]|nr:hypothetical protein [Lachnospiraceae bacterium]